VLVLAASCTDVNRCRTGTAFVDVTLLGPAQQASHLEFDVNVSGRGAMHTSLPHTPGAAKGAVEIDFAGGYQTGLSVSVYAAATNTANVTLASVSVAWVLPSGCLHEAITIGATPDLAGADLACTHQPESCFNGIDDDCDGLVDCADDDCAPSATCVPAAAGFAPGFVIPMAQQCPAGFTAVATPLLRGPTGGCTNTCACGACRATLSAGNVSCGSTNGAYGQLDSSSGCHLISPIFTNPENIDVSAATTCASSGTSTPAALGWTEQSKFCAANAVGGGCPSGLVCAPLAPGATCVYQTGDVVCPAVYSNATTYYTDVTDDRRCACGCTPSGSCNNASVEFFSDGACGTMLYTLLFGANSCGVSTTTPGSAKVIGTPATCAVTTMSGTGLAGKNPETVCCR
jgi:hypothetical protein